jgi:hypothetical protein
MEVTGEYDDMPAIEPIPTQTQTPTETEPETLFVFPPIGELVNMPLLASAPGDEPELGLVPPPVVDLLPAPAPAAEPAPAPAAAEPVPAPVPAADTKPEVNTVDEFSDDDDDNEEEEEQGEEEGEEEQEEQEEEQEEQEEQEEELPNSASSWQIPTDLGVRAIAMFNVVWTYLLTLKTTAVDLGMKVYRATMPDTYVFFGSCPFPYRMTDVNTSGPAVAPVSWYYDADTHFFLSARMYDTQKPYRAHHLPFLSATIKYDSLVLYDISDFVESLKWAGDEGEEHPPVSFILAAWTLRSGVVVQNSERLRLEVIDDNGDTVQLPFM